jgi:mannose-1-phosphate guanylyltransferase/phosphomannomutase
LNAYPDERRLTRRMLEAQDAIRQVGKIVTALNADVGFYVSPGGQNLQLVDDRGRVRDQSEALLFTLKLLVKASEPGVRVFLPVTAPRALDETEPGLRITRGKVTSLKTSHMHEYAFVSEAEGKFAFPSFLHAPDAMYGIAKILELLSRADRKVSEVFDELPAYTYIKKVMPCPVEAKGLAMRRMSEDSIDKDATFVDGVQVAVDGVSVLLLPDPYRPLLHLVVEGPDAGAASRMLAQYETKVRDWIGA